MHEFQKRLHPIIDDICLPLLILNHDEDALFEARDASGFYIQNLQRILSPETETPNHAKMHAWNTVYFMIEDYGDLMPKMAMLDPNQYRLKSAMYLIIINFGFTDISSEAMLALQQDAEIYKSDIADLDRETHARWIREFNN